MSTVESEYIALSESVAELLWLKKLLVSLDFEISRPIIFEDNLNCINLAKDTQNSSKRIKHIDVKYHFVKDVISRREVQLKFVLGESQVADIFTKSSDRFTFENHRCSLKLY